MTQQLETLAPYVGGKRIIAKQIVQRIADTPHHCYAEPFVGMGGVFLRKNRSRVEAINDLNGEIINLFRVTRAHPDELCRVMGFTVPSRSEHARLHEIPPHTLTDIERAARWLSLQLWSFLGNQNSRTFMASPTRRPNAVSRRRLQIIKGMAERLRDVCVENLPWHRFVDLYDRPTTLFYLDPPYPSVPNYYAAPTWTVPDFEALADKLAAIKGRFILSIGCSPKTDHLWDRFTVATLEHARGVQGGKMQELLVTGGGG